MDRDQLRGACVSAALPLIPKQNNIGLLRLLFAAIVVLAHLYALSLKPALAWLQPLANAELAVQGFFVLSGFLVVMSYENSPNWRDYAGKRFRRIYPAYAAVVLLCALFGFAFTSSADYFNAQWLRYMLANLVFLNFLAPELPGVFTGNPVTAVNGALWTIKIEVMFYAIVPLLVWLLKGKRRLPFIAAIYAGSLAYRYLCAKHGLEELGRQLPGQLCFFISGVALYYYFAWLMAHKAQAALIAVAGIALALLTPYDALYPLGIALLVMLAAFGPHLGNIEKHGDFSYGAYIWHFPIIQALVALKMFNVDLGLAFALSLGLTALAAYLSWRFVERPALRKNSHYIQATA